MEQQTQFEGETKIIRRALLPWWIKIFCWLFMLLGAASILGIIAGLLEYNFALSIYGFETQYPVSNMGLIVFAIMLFKGFAAYSLWFEKDYAINVAKIDAIGGIALCIVSMVAMLLSPEHSGITFRLEILLLIPYFIKINRIEYEWDNLEPQ